MASKKKTAARKAAKRSRPQRRSARKAVPAAEFELIPGELKVFEPQTLSELLNTGTRARLEAFCAAHHGATPDVVIHKAIEDFITSDLEANAGVASDYKGGSV